MFGPDYAAGCPSCSAIADGFDGFAVHLANHDVTLCGGVAGAAREAAGVQAADGVDVPLGVVVRKRFSLDFRRAWTEEQQRERPSSTTTDAEGQTSLLESGKQGPPPSWRSHDRHRAGRRTFASGRA